MSRLGVEIVSNACQAITMAMKSDMLDETELKDLRRMFAEGVEICDKWIAKLEAIAIGNEV